MGSLTKTPYLVLIVLLGGIGIGAVSAVGVVTFNSPLDMGSNQINNLAAPTADTDAANKDYVDSAVPVTIKRVTLNDDTAGNAAGWNPPQTSQFIALQILEPDATISSNLLVTISSEPEPNFFEGAVGPSDLACKIVTVISGKIFLNNCNTLFVKEGASLHYTLFNPIP